ncbi:hypothetical protein SODG_003540 [Sodalis praecaptivus]
MAYLLFAVKCLADNILPGDRWKGWAPHHSLAGTGVNTPLRKKGKWLVLPEAAL